MYSLDEVDVIEKDDEGKGIQVNIDDKVKKEDAGSSDGDDDDDDEENVPLFRRVSLSGKDANHLTWNDLTGEEWFGRIDRTFEPLNGKVLPNYPDFESMAEFQMAIKVQREYFNRQKRTIMVNMMELMDINL